MCVRAAAIEVFCVNTEAPPTQRAFARWLRSDDAVIQVHVVRWTEPELRRSSETAMQHTVEGTWSVVCVCARSLRDGEQLSDLDFLGIRPTAIGSFLVVCSFHVVADVGPCPCRCVVGKTSSAIQIYGIQLGFRTPRAVWSSGRNDCGAAGGGRRPPPPIIPHSPPRRSSRPPPPDRTIILSWMQHKKKRSVKYDSRAQL